MSEFSGKGKVAVLKASPATILEDIERLMTLANVESALPKDVTTGLKINISWQTWYPACSTTPWQLEGVIRALRKFGYSDLEHFRRELAGPPGLLLYLADNAGEQFFDLPLVALLRRLDALKVLHFHKSKTNGEYLREYPGQRAGREQQQLTARLPAQFPGLVAVYDLVDHLFTFANHEGPVLFEPDLCSDFQRVPPNILTKPTQDGTLLAQGTCP